jgi:ankyrin repeat protein
MGNTDIYAALLKSRADVDSLNEYSWTSLPLAIHSSRSADTVQFLVERGAHINHAEDEGWTSLHFAVDYGWPGLIKYLLGHGADSTIENARKDTPLRLAASWVDYWIELRAFGMWS